MKIESLATHLFFFGRVITITSLIAFVAWIQKFDAEDFREDALDLNIW